VERTDRVLLLHTGPPDERLTATLAAPQPRHRRRLAHTVQACAADPLAIARTIEAGYADHDAFIVLAAADTLVYTAAALSFMLEQLGKPVILVDAARAPTDDLPGALEIAGHYEIPEVCILSDHALLRGNRARRGESHGRAVFTASSFPPLVHLGREIRVAWERILATPTRPLRVVPIARNDVAVLPLFPGVSAEILGKLLAPPLQGAVLDGHLQLTRHLAPPSTHANPPAAHANPPGDLLATLRDAHARGLVLVLVSPGQHGPRDDDPALVAAGVHGGADMTPEAALAKLCYLLSRYRDRADVARLLHVDLRGELTTADRHNRFSFRERVFVASVARALADAGENVTRHDVERALFPVLMCSAGGLGDTTALARLLAGGADVDAADYDGRTALHLAASEGQVAALELLLGKGARVDVTDRWGGTPLQDAVRQRQRPAVGVLRRHGARLTGDFSADLCALAAAGDLEGLGLWIEAGVDHRSADYDGRTALHLAAAEGRLDVVRLLLACGADPRVVDRWGCTPIHEARRAGHQAVAEQLAAHLATAM
jgi:lysophospholipase